MVNLKNEKKILVVDDDPTVLEMINDGLLKNGFDVITASNPGEANKKLNGESIPIALIDLDLGWPHKNGIEFGMELQDQAPETIIIIMTGYHNIEHVVAAAREHRFFYMIKPFRIDQIVSLIERARRELHLISENKKLLQEVTRLKEENERLKFLVEKYGAEEDSRKDQLTEKNVKQPISKADVAQSYARHQKPDINKPSKNNKVK